MPQKQYNQKKKLKAVGATHSGPAGSVAFGGMKFSTQLPNSPSKFDRSNPFYISPRKKDGNQTQFPESNNNSSQISQSNLQTSHRDSQSINSQSPAKFSTNSNNYALRQEQPFEHTQSNLLKNDACDAVLLHSQKKMAHAHKHTTNKHTQKYFTLCLLCVV